MLGSFFPMMASSDPSRCPAVSRTGSQAPPVPIGHHRAKIKNNADAGIDTMSEKIRPAPPAIESAKIEVVQRAVNVHRSGRAQIDRGNAREIINASITTGMDAFVRRPTSHSPSLTPLLLRRSRQPSATARMASEATHTPMSLKIKRSRIEHALSGPRIFELR